jgi:hypothetical protein
MSADTPYLARVTSADAARVTSVERVAAASLCVSVPLRCACNNRVHEKMCDKKGASRYRLCNEWILLLLLLLLLWCH